MRGKAGMLSRRIGDEFFSSVAVLLSLNGTTFVDSSAAARTVDVQGDAALSATQAKFGDKSLFCDGFGDGVTITHETANGFSADQGDWTIEMWAYPEDERDAHLVIISNSGLSQTGLSVYLTSSGTITLNNASAPAFDSGSYTLNEWQHFAFVRSGSTITIYRNGVSQGTTNQTPASSGTRIAFGFSAANFGNHFYAGYLDDIRYTRGVARYTSNFTPPTAALSNF